MAVAAAVPEDDGTRPDEVVTVQPSLIVLTGLPSMLRDVVRTIVVKDPALELVGGGEVADMPTALATGADVVVFREGDVSEGQAEEALRWRCRTRLIGLAPDGATATVIQLRPHVEVLRDVGGACLAEILRGTQAD